MPYKILIIALALYVDTAYGRSIDNGKRSIDSEVEERFKALDTNHDCVISLEEASTELREKYPLEPEEWLKEVFDEVDENKDGQIQPGEFNPSLNGMKCDVKVKRETEQGADDAEAAKAKLFNEIDADNDENLTSEEMINNGLKCIEERMKKDMSWFTRMDKNADGLIQLGEIPRHYRFYMKCNNKKEASGADDAQLLSEMDTDNDGSLSSEEIINHRLKCVEEAMKDDMSWFTRMDKNEDGSIQIDEFAYCG